MLEPGEIPVASDNKDIECKRRKLKSLNKDESESCIKPDRPIQD